MKLKQWLQLFIILLIVLITFLVWPRHSLPSVQAPLPIESKITKLSETIVIATSSELVESVGEISQTIVATSSLLTTPTTPPTILLAVPFTTQAPLAEWTDEHQADGCEEAVVAMAMAWVNQEQNITPTEWRERILALSNFEKQQYGAYRDVALIDMQQWLLLDYFNYQKTSLQAVRSVADIIKVLEKGQLVLLPMNGQMLANPYFTAPGPERHMILVKGYNYATQEFIVNDPGTRRGESYLYSEKIIIAALRPYATGYHEPFTASSSEMLVIFQ